MDIRQGSQSTQGRAPEATVSGAREINRAREIRQGYQSTQGTAPEATRTGLPVSMASGAWEIERAGEIKRAVGRDLSAGKRSTASKARRESEEQIPRQPEAGFCRDDRAEAPQRAITAIQIYSQHVSSKFPANSLKTKDRCPYKAQQKARPVYPARRDAKIGLPSEQRESRGNEPIYSTHVPSKYRPNSLKRNDGCTCKVTLKQRPDEGLCPEGESRPRDLSCIQRLAKSSDFAPCPTISIMMGRTK
jgi:hypothetical protein